jgi:dTDP-D-glucose 4,6-dehydratase
MMEEKTRERQFSGVLLEDLYEDKNVNLTFSNTIDNRNILSIIGGGGSFKDFIYINDIIEMKVGSAQDNSIIIKYLIKDEIMIRSIKLVENCNEVIGVYSMFKNRV